MSKTVYRSGLRKERLSEKPGLHIGLFGEALIFGEKLPLFEKFN